MIQDRLKQFGDPILILEVGPPDKSRNKKQIFFM